MRIPIPARAAYSTSMNRWTGPVAAFVICAACAPKPKPEETPEPKPSGGRMELVGRIASVRKDPEFVLIQTYGNWRAEPGTILTTRGLERRTASLLATGEAMGQYAAADVKAGEAAVGDAVFSLAPVPPEDPGPPNTTEEHPQPLENPEG
jgi:hypothetical protein